MTKAEIQEILDRISYEDYKFTVLLKTDTLYLQGFYLEHDIITKCVVEQHTRKWLISEHAVPSEIVQTALLCALTSAEHRVREHFLYRGERIFGPHFDIEALVEVARQRKLDYRGKSLKKS